MPGQGINFFFENSEVPLATPRLVVAARNQKTKRGSCWPLVAYCRLQASRIGGQGLLDRPNLLYLPHCRLPDLGVAVSLVLKSNLFNE